MVAMAIARFVNFFRPLKVQSRESFTVFLRHFQCKEVVAEFYAKNDADSADVFHPVICFSAVSPSGRRVIYPPEFTWSKRITGITLDLLSMESRVVISGRLRSIAEVEFAKIRKEAPGIQFRVVDLDGCRWSMADDGHWRA